MGTASSTGDGPALTDVDIAQALQLLRDAGVARHVAEAALIKEHGDVSAAMLLATDDAFAATVPEPNTPEVTSTATATVGSDPVASPPPPPPPPQPPRALPELERMTSLEVLSAWSDPAREILPEYRPAVDMCCVTMDIMGSSMQQQLLAALEVRARDKPLGEPFETTCERAVAAAFGVARGRSARGYYGEVPELSSGNFFNLVMQFYSMVGWERVYLHTALREQVEVAEAACEPGSGGVDMDLQVSLGLLGRGAQQCEARRRWAFSAVVNRVPGLEATVAAASPFSTVTSTPAATAGSGSGSGAGAGAGEGSGHDTARFNSARAQLYSYLVEVIDDTKDKAFRSVFEEPTKYYFKKVGDMVMEGDVNVHGVNSYLAVLLSTIGVRLTRTPLLSDEAKGIASVLDAGDTMRKALDALWAPENLGKAWQGVPECARSSHLRGSRVRTVPRNSFCGLRGHTPSRLANAAVDGSSGAASSRRKVAAYLEAFMRYFTEEALLPRLVSRLVGEEGRLPLLQAIYDEIRGRDKAAKAGVAGAARLDAGDADAGMTPSDAAASGDGGGSADDGVDDDEEDVRMAVWDLEVDPPRMRMDVARRLFGAIGILKTP